MSVWDDQKMDFEIFFQIMENCHILVLINNIFSFFSYKFAKQANMG